MSDKPPVLALTQGTPLIFPTLEAALTSRQVAFHDTIFLNEQNFLTACNLNRLNHICDVYGLEKPSDINDGRSNAGQVIWTALNALAQPGDAQQSRKKGANMANDDQDLETPQEGAEGEGGESAPRPKKARRSSGGNGRRVKYGDDWTISVLVEGNPKRGTAAQRFALYQTGMTVGAYIAAGGYREDINWDSRPQNNWIKVEAPAQ